MRAGLALAAVCAAVALACETGAPQPREDAGRPEAGAAAAPAAPRGAAPAPGRRGDRHARAAARGGARPLREVTGTVVRSEGGRVAIRPREGREITLQIGPRTTITPRRGDPPGKALAPGDEVRASWRAGGDPPTALSVDVQASEAPWTDRG